MCGRSRIASEPTITQGVDSDVSMSSSDMANAAVSLLSAFAFRQPASSRRLGVPATWRSPYEMPYFCWKSRNRAVPALVAQNLYG